MSLCHFSNCVVQETGAYWTDARTRVHSLKAAEIWKKRVEKKSLNRQLCVHAAAWENCTLSAELSQNHKGCGGRRRRRRLWSESARRGCYIRRGAETLWCRGFQSKIFLHWVSTARLQSAICTDTRLSHTGRDVRGWGVGGVKGTSYDCLYLSRDATRGILRCSVQLGRRCRVSL